MEVPRVVPEVSPLEVEALDVDPLDVEALEVEALDVDPPDVDMGESVDVVSLPESVSPPVSSVPSPDDASACPSPRLDPVADSRGAESPQDATAMVTTICAIHRIDARSIR